MPRLTQEQINLLPDPADGLMVYCTTDRKVYVFNSNLNAWKELLIGPEFISLPITCGKPFTKYHTTGTVAPVSKMVTYGTVSGIPGEPSQCWITQDLGPITRQVRW
jgi:hypothetical protein